MGATFHAKYIKTPIDQKKNHVSVAVFWPIDPVFASIGTFGVRPSRLPSEVIKTDYRTRNRMQKSGAGVGIGTLICDRDHFAQK